MKHVSIAVALAFALALPTAALARGNAAAGKDKSAVCVACHGADGNAADPQYPRLAGQWENYLLHSLNAYKSGARTNPIMQGFASTLSAQDMEDLSAYYASLPGKLDDLRRHIQGSDGK